MRPVFTCRVTLYSWVSVRMAFFTTFTLSSFNNMFRLAISRRSSSLSLLLDEQNNRKSLESFKWICRYNKHNKISSLTTHHASSMKPMTNFLTSIDLSVWKAIISYRVRITNQSQSVKVRFATFYFFCASLVNNVPFTLNANVSTFKKVYIHIYHIYFS